MASGGRQLTGASEFLSWFKPVEMDDNLGDTRSIWVRLDFKARSRGQSQTSSLYRIASELQAPEGQHDIVRQATQGTYGD